MSNKRFIYDIEKYRGVLLWLSTTNNIQDDIPSHPFHLTGGLRPMNGKVYVVKKNNSFILSLSSEILHRGKSISQVLDAIITLDKNQPTISIRPNFLGWAVIVGAAIFYACIYIFSTSRMPIEIHFMLYLIVLVYFMILRRRFNRFVIDYLNNSVEQNII